MIVTDYDDAGPFAHRRDGGSACAHEDGVLKGRTFFSVRRNFTRQSANALNVISPHEAPTVTRFF